MTCEQKLIELKIAVNSVTELKKVLEEMFAKAEPLTVSAVVEAVKVEKAVAVKKPKAEPVAEAKPAVTVVAVADEKPVVVAVPEAPAVEPYTQDMLIGLVVNNAAAKLREMDEAIFLKFSDELKGTIYVKHRIKVLADAEKMNDVERGIMAADVKTLMAKYGL